jgi:hypothetical protein
MASFDAAVGHEVHEGGEYRKAIIVLDTARRGGYNGDSCLT